jgi:hypothetical protein
VPTIPVDRLLFDIKTTYDAQKYDEWDYYRSVLQPQKSYSAMDLVIARAQQSPVEVWLVEAKDFRMITRPPERSNLNGLAETVAKKVSDTLAGLRDAAGAAAQTNERRLADTWSLIRATVRNCFPRTSRAGFCRNYGRWWATSIRNRWF